jgi:CRP/FNR family transcriptional regulator, polysaccharide utilization system transcription regulator
MQYSNQYIEQCLEGPSSIFKGLHQKEKETISQSHHIHIFKKGDSIFGEGDKSRGLIYLASGKVKLHKVGVGGREQILKMVKPNEFIGYRVLFAETNWSFSATAIEETIICSLEKNVILRILKKYHELSIRIIRTLTEELWISNNRIISLTQKHVRGRIAESLLLLSDTYGFEADGKTIAVSLSREDIANLSSMTPSNAIRTLSNFSAEGVIAIRRRKISILDNGILEQISELG